MLDSSIPIAIAIVTVAIVIFIGSWWQHRKHKRELERLLKILTIVNEELVKVVKSNPIIAGSVGELGAKDE